MGLFDWAKKKKKNISTKSDTDNLVWFDSTGRILGHGQKGFKSITEAQHKPSFYEIQEDAFGRSPWVYIIVDRIAKGCADVPLDLMNFEEEEISPALNRTQKVRELRSLLESPQSTLTKYSFPQLVYSTCANYLLNGNGYMVGLPYNMEQPVRFQSLISPLSSNVSINEGIKAFINSYTFEYHNLSDTIKPEDILHMHNPNLVEDIYEGHSAMQSLVNIWKANNAVNINEQFIHERKGANGIIHSKGGLAQVESERKESEKKLDEITSNFDRAGRYTYMPNEVGYIDLSKSFKELQARDSKDAHRETIAAAYNYPVVLLNDTSASSYNNIKTAEAGAFDKAILPVLDMFLEGFNKWLIRDNYQLMTVKLGYKRQDIPELNIVNKDKTDDNVARTNLVLSVQNSLQGEIVDPKAREKAINTLIITGGFTREEAEEML